MDDFDAFLANSSSFTAAAEIEEAPIVRQRRITEYPPFYVNKLSVRLPPETRRWIRTAADERAAIEFGCRYSERIGQYAVDWMESNCTLYEGDTFAGELMRVDDWQYETVMQIYGWQLFDEEWEVRKKGAGWLRRYKVFSGWIPKKNAKSPTLAAHGLYNFCGDGEQGQKCFSLATTREQALISHTHALNFVRQSPSLLSHCRIDATTGAISDGWTNSTYSILCGDKGLHTTSKEGINGDLFIDETHVVNNAFMQVVSRAGISRRQFLKGQLSTSGKDTGGYGFEQYQYGRNNLKAAANGAPFNHRFYHFEYSIPQDTSIDELRDPTKIKGFILQSNPSIGRIVRLTEAVEDWQESLKSDTALIEYAMYRLNQWNTGGGSFIAGSDWGRCLSHFKLEDVKPYPCVIGVDMSRIADMTAVVACWVIPKVISLPENPLDPASEYIEREINIPHIMPMFWVPQRTIDQYKANIDVYDLAKKKNLFITKNKVVKAEVIAEYIAWMDKTFDIRGVASDTAYSRALAAALSTHHGWDIEGPDSRFFLIPQRGDVVGPAIEQLKGCVLEKEFIHNGNPVMDWQLTNVVIHEDTKGNETISKPTKNDFRKVDGWHALTNAYVTLMNDPELYPGRTLSIKMGV